MKTVTLIVQGKADTYEYVIDLHTDNPTRTDISTAYLVKQGSKASNWVVEAIQAGHYEIKDQVHEYLLSTNLRPQGA